MKKLQTFVLFVFLMVSWEGYAYPEVVLEGNNFITVWMDDTGNHEYRYGLYSWRLGFNSVISYRNYTNLNASAFNNAGAEIQSKLGYSFTLEQLPWNQGPYANRLFLSENNYGVSSWDALSLVYIVKTDGDFIFCQNHTISADTEGDILVSATVYGVDNSLCSIALGKRVNAGMLVFNEDKSFSVTEQTHLILHEFSHLFGLEHLQYFGHPETYQCDSLMIKSKDACDPIPPASTIGSADATALNYLKTDNSIGP